MGNPLGFKLSWFWPFFAPSCALWGESFCLSIQGPPMPETFRLFVMAMLARAYPRMIWMTRNRT